MRFPKWFRSNASAAAANPAPDAAPPRRDPIVVEGLVNVLADGVVTVACQLAQDELNPGTLRCLSWLSDEDRQSFASLPSEAFTGALVQREPDRPDLFIANVAFFEFLQFAIAIVGPHLTDLQAAAAHAKRAGGLNLWIYDARIDPWLMDHPDEMPADEEAIGLFLVGDGRVTTERYMRNTKYNRWSSNGPTRIPVQFYDAVLEHLRSGASYYPPAPAQP